MAAEIKFNARGLTGSTLYAVVLNSAGQAWNGAAFESLAALNWATYDIALTEQASLGIWLGTFPVVAAGLYAVVVYQQAGGTPATSDVQVGGGSMDWNGTREQSAESDIIRTATAAGGGASTITLDASASATNNFYNRNRVAIIGGTGAGQNRLATAYVGSSKLLTVDRAWTVNPDNTSVFEIRPAAGDVSTWYGEAVEAPATTGIPRVDLRTVESTDATDYFDTQFGIISAKTNNLPSDPADQSLIIAATTSILADTAAILADTGTDGVVVAAGSKTGYSLAASGLDAISADVPNGVATTFRGRLMQTWGRFFYRHFWNKLLGKIFTYRSDGTTINTEQVVTTSTSAGDDVGPASAP